MDKKSESKKSNGRKRNGSGRCVLCLEEVENLTREHLLPKAWYIPDLTTEKTIRQTFPSCSDCNSSFEKSEARLLQTLGLSLNPESGITASIAKKVIHSLSMSEAPNAKEADIRGKKKLKLFKEMSRVKNCVNFEELRLLPGLQVSNEELKNGFYLTEVSITDVQKLMEKIVRGVMYLEYQLFIDNDQQIQWHPEKPEFFKFAERSRHLVIPSGLIVHFGPIPFEEYPAMLFIIEIWGRLLIHAAVTPGKNSIWTDTVLERIETEPLWDIESSTYEI